MRSRKPDHPPIGVLDSKWVGLPVRNLWFRSRTRLLGLVMMLSIVLGDGLAQAEIFKWKDQTGRLHFAQDLNQVPPQYREQAKGGAQKEGEGSVIQHYEPTVPAAPRSNPRASRATRASGEIHKIRVERSGSTMRVNVRLNGSVVAPFLVDTGASDVVLPEWVARELGLELEGARTAYYGTANGTIQQTLVTLDSVELGGAKVEKVPAAVSTTMSIGLLGLSFFNHFKYDFDPAAGVITLRPNGLVESGMIRGGRGRSQWHGQFASLSQRRAMLERELGEINPNWARRKAEIKQEIEEVERQRAVLESEADDARVPMQWRD